jgi:hypothetical protein
VPRRCSICDHDECHQIDVALVHREPWRHIASRFSVTTGSLQRHSKEHLPELLVKAYEATRRDDAEDLNAELFRLKVDVHRLRGRAEDEGDLRTALLGCDKALKALELQAKVAQIIQSQPTTTNYVFISPVVTEAIVAALRPYPEAGYAVSDVLKELEANGSQ